MNITVPYSAGRGRNLAAFKSVKAAFQENEAEFRNLVRNLKIGVVAHGVDMVVQYTSVGVKHFVSKPYTAETMLNILAEALRE